MDATQAAAVVSSILADLVTSVQVVATNPDVASTLAWSNMWGNFGASAVAKVIPLVLASTIHQPDWSEIFYLCAAGFVILTVTGASIDSTRTLDQPAT